MFRTTAVWKEKTLTQGLILSIENKITDWIPIFADLIYYIVFYVVHK